MIDLIFGQEFSKKVIPLIDSAQHTIKIIVFDWRWYPMDPSNPVQLFNQAFVRAKNRGVKIEVISNTEETLRTLKSLGIDAKRPSIKNLIHAKMMLIDGKTLIIGSHNYTQSAFTMNYEVSIIIENFEKADAVNQFFNNLFFYQ